MGVVDRIRTLCEENSITINKLEKEVGIGRGNIARWDKHKPNIVNVQKVADFFNVSTDYILTGKKNKPTDDGELLDDEAYKIMDLLISAPEWKRKAVLALLEAEDKA